MKLKRNFYFLRFIWPWDNNWFDEFAAPLNPFGRLCKWVWFKEAYGPETEYMLFGFNFVEERFYHDQF